MGRRIGRAGFLISLEGIDGVGKTTQGARLAEWLRRQGYDVISLREPGGTSLGEALREVVLHRVEISDVLAEFLVFAAARAELMSSVIAPHLATGGVVVMDRFIDSSLAYQGYGRGLSLEIIRAVNGWATGGRMPDLTIWLFGRPWSDGGGDRVEDRSPAFFSRVLAGYEELIRREPHRWLAIDAHRAMDQIFHEIQKVVAARLEETGKGGAV